jgi:hypothetical protein
MSHHGSEPLDDGPLGPMEAARRRQQHIDSLMETVATFKGAIGTYPEGKIDKTDEGAIQFSVGERGNAVVLDFGTSVHWVGMTPQQAADVASALLKQARLVARRNGESVAFVIG